MSTNLGRTVESAASGAQCFTAFDVKMICWGHALTVLGVNQVGVSLADRSVLHPAAKPPLPRATPFPMLDGDLGELLNVVQRHTKCSTESCLRPVTAEKKEQLAAEDHRIGEARRRLNQLGMECRFSFPKPLSQRTVVQFELHSETGALSASVVTRRNDMLLNSHNPLQLQYWRANVDFQILTDSRHAVQYASKYASKRERSSVSGIELLNRAIKGVERKPTLRPGLSVLLRMANMTLGERDYSHQEAVHMLLQLPLVSKPYRVEVVNLTGSHMLDLSIGSDTDDETVSGADRRRRQRRAMRRTLLDAYKERDGPPDDVSLFEFALRYHIDERGALRARRKPVTIRFVPDFRHAAASDHPMHWRFCEYMLLQFKPWLHTPHQPPTADVPHTAEHTRQPGPTEQEWFIHEWAQFMTSDRARTDEHLRRKLAVIHASSKPDSLRQPSREQHPESSEDSTDDQGLLQQHPRFVRDHQVVDEAAALSRHPRFAGGDYDDSDGEFGGAAVEGDSGRFDDLQLQQQAAQNHAFWIEHSRQWSSRLGADVDVTEWLQEQKGDEARVYVAADQLVIKSLLPAAIALPIDGILPEDLTLPRGEVSASASSATVDKLNAEQRVAWDRVRVYHNGVVAARRAAVEAYIAEYQQHSVVGTRHMSRSELESARARAARAAQATFAARKPAPLGMIVYGKAGTGKSFLIQGLRDLLGPAVLLMAPTGRAAKQIGGRTVHDALSLPNSKKGAYYTEWPPMDPRKHHQVSTSMAAAEVLLIDEFGMLGQRALYAANRRAQDASPSPRFDPVVSASNLAQFTSATLGQDGLFDAHDTLPDFAEVAQPFGGHMVVLLGDHNQLPPVKDPPLYADVPPPGKKSRLDPFADQGRALYRSFFTEAVILTRPQRQSADTEASFLRALESLRAGVADESSFRFFCREREATLSRLEWARSGRRPVILVSTNREVSEHNLQCLIDEKRQVAVIPAVHSGAGKRGEEAALAAMKMPDHNKEGLLAKTALAIGAPVMLTRNLWTKAGLNNGTMGELIALLWSEGKGEASIGPPHMPLAAICRFPGYTGPSILDDIPGSCIIIPQKAHVSLEGDLRCGAVNAAAKVKNGQVKSDAVVTRIQLPLRVSYAMTVHKSQGGTYDCVWVDFGAVSRDLHGASLYVAASRARRGQDLAFTGMSYEQYKKLVGRNPVQLAALRSEEQRLFELAELTAGRAPVLSGCVGGVDAAAHTAPRDEQVHGNVRNAPDAAVLLAQKRAQISAVPSAKRVALSMDSFVESGVVPQVTLTRKRSSQMNTPSPKRGAQLAPSDSPVTATYDSLFGLPYQSNSCWLDTSVELLHCMHANGAPAQRLADVDHQPYDWLLQQSLQLRVDLEQGASPMDIIAARKDRWNSAESASKRANRPSGGTQYVPPCGVAHYFDSTSSYIEKLAIGSVQFECANCGDVATRSLNFAAARAPESSTAEHFCLAALANHLDRRCANPACCHHLTHSVVVWPAVMTLRHPFHAWEYSQVVADTLHFGPAGPTYHCLAVILFGIARRHFVGLFKYNNFWQYYDDTQRGGALRRLSANSLAQILRHREFEHCEIALVVYKS